VGSFSGDARAVGPVEVEVAAKVGAGTNPTGGLPNPLGFGAGARAGVSFDGFYAGLSAVYYVGSSGRIDYGVSEYVTGDISPHALLYGLEVGYGVKVARVLELRAQIGGGDDFFGSGGTLSYGCTCNNIVIPPVSVRSSHYLYWEPALTALVDFGTLFVGVDVGALILPSGPVVIANGAGPYTVASLPFSDEQKVEGALTAHGQIGAHF